MFSVRAAVLFAPLFAPTNPLQSLTDALIANLQGLAIPGAVIGILFAIFAFLIGPIFPDLSPASKGYIQKALLAVAVIGFIPGLVQTLAAMGGGGTGGG